MTKFENIKQVQRQIPGSAGKPVNLDVCFNPKEQGQPIVVFAHGFKGFKDWGPFNYLAHRLAEAGMMVVKPNFSHNGTSLDHPEDFVDLDAFGDNNYSIELNDLELVIDWVLTEPSLRGLTQPENLFLLGHSRGGGIVLLKAAEDERVAKVATWAAVSDLLERLLNYDVEKWRKDGVIHILNGRTGQQMPLKLQLLEDVEQNPQRLSIPDAVSGLRIPQLIIHGTSDLAVPAEGAKRLAEFNPEAKLLLVPETGHTFGAAHPFNNEEIPEALETVIGETIAFFRD